MVTMINIPDHVEAWEIVLSQLRAEMSRANFETWVKALVPLGFYDDSKNVFQIAVANEYTRDWVKSRLGGKINRLLSGLYVRSIDVEFIISNGFYQKQSLQKLQTEKVQEYKETKSSAVRKKGKTEDPGLEEEKQSETVKDFDPEEDSHDVKAPVRNKRKMVLQRVYGSERASVIQPERGMFETNYLWDKWVPLIGHSGYATIKAARRLCYWNPITGEMRNKVETEMTDLADRAQLSVRTLKTMLNNELIKKYFIRYIVRRTMTPNGIRTAGITLQVRMDDPLTPEDQERIGYQEVGTWFEEIFDHENEDIDE
jgi:hypothetical protein